jgi:hypothetical protein
MRSTDSNRLRILGRTARGLAVFGLILAGFTGAASAKSDNDWRPPRPAIGGFDKPAAPPPPWSVPGFDPGHGAPPSIIVYPPSPPGPIAPDWHEGPYW